MPSARASPTWTYGQSIITAKTEHRAELKALRAAHSNRFFGETNPQPMRGTALHVHGTVIQPGGTEQTVESSTLNSRRFPYRL